MILVDGSRQQIHLRITILHAMPITREQRPGFSKEVPITNGSQQGPTHSSGFMGNVRPYFMPPPDATYYHPFYVAGSGKSVLWFVEPPLFCQP